MRAARLAGTVKRSTFEPPPGVYIGCSGWFYWHWRGLFYPQALPTKEWFRHYAKQFKTVELNAPFYAWPTVANVQSWPKQAGRGRFIYTVKACELITHIKRFTGTKKLIEDFGYIADLLGPRMGCFLFQLPPSFRYTAARLTKIVSQLASTRRAVVEFRHRSWWREDVYSAFRAAGIAFCSCSGPRLPDELIRTSDDVYVRLHGTKQWYRHDYSDEELQLWADRINACDAKRVWVYFNNDRDAFAIKNARTLTRMLKRLAKKPRPASQRARPLKPTSSSSTPPRSPARGNASSKTRAADRARQ